jgi:hypothetical protein
MPKIKYEDGPFLAAFEEANQHRRKGATIFQKWTCSGCGARLSGGPNTWTTKGRCDEVEGKPGCGHITNIEKVGCNYAVVFAFGGSDADAKLDEIINHLNKKGMH